MSRMYYGFFHGTDCPQGLMWVVSPLMAHRLRLGESFTCPTWGPQPPITRLPGGNLRSGLDGPGVLLRASYCAPATAHFQSVTTHRSLSLCPEIYTLPP